MAKRSGRDLYQGAFAAHATSGIALVTTLLVAIAAIAVVFFLLLHMGERVRGGFNLDGRPIVTTKYYESPFMLPGAQAFTVGRVQRYKYADPNDPENIKAGKRVVTREVEAHENRHTVQCEDAKGPEWGHGGSVIAKIARGWKVGTFLFSYLGKKLLRICRIPVRDLYEDEANADQASIANGTHPRIKMLP